MPTGRPRDRGRSTETLTEDDEILTVAEVAKYFRVSVSTIYRQIRAEKLPAFKVGADYRFSRTQVAAWAKSKTIPQKEAQ